MNNEWFTAEEFCIDFYLTSTLEFIFFSLTENKSIVKKTYIKLNMHIFITL